MFEEGAAHARDGCDRSRSTLFQRFWLCAKRQTHFHMLVLDGASFVGTQPPVFRQDRMARASLRCKCWWSVSPRASAARWSARRCWFGILDNSFLAFDLGNAVHTEPRSFGAIVNRRERKGGERCVRVPRCAPPFIDPQGRRAARSSQHRRRADVRADALARGVHHFEALVSDTGLMSSDAGYARALEPHRDPHEQKSPANEFISDCKCARLLVRSFNPRID